MLDVTTISSGRAGCAALGAAANMAPPAANAYRARRGFLDGRIFMRACLVDSGRKASARQNWRGSRVTTPLRSAPRLTQRELTCSAGLLADRCDSLRLPEARSLSGISHESFAANSCGGSSGFETSLSPDSLLVALAC